MRGKDGQKNSDFLFNSRNYGHHFEKQKVKTLLNFMFLTGKLFRSATGLVQKFETGVYI